MTPLRTLLAGRRFPVPDGTKDDRGTLVVIGGSPECPGGVVLAGLAALRAGCGRVQLVVDGAVAHAVAVAVPEALVVGWDLSREPPPQVERASAVVFGCGLGHDPGPGVDAVAAATDAPLVLDAGALAALDRVVGRPALVLAPNEAEADGPASVLAQRVGGPVAVRGPTTVVADGAGGEWSERGAAVLGTPGSGDVLMGLLGALLAREVDALDALAWAIVVHAEAGLGLEQQRPFGWLAREVCDELPAAALRI